MGTHAPTTFSRRRLLSSIAGGMALAPFLPLLNEDALAARRPIRRLIVVYNANGVYGPEWIPRGEGAGLELHGSLAPLAPFRRHLLVLQGMHMKEHGNHMPHAGGPTMLTNWRWPFPGITGGVTSIDQLIAARHAQVTRFPSLDYMVHTRTNAQNGISFRNGHFVRPEENPHRAFERLFGDAAAGSRAPEDRAAVRLARRRSVLDDVAADLERTRRRLGGEDQALIEAHLESLRGIERRLGQVAGPRCKPTRPPAEDLDAGQFAHLPTVGRAYIDMIVAALACDLTRVATLQWHRIASALRYTWLGAPYDRFDHHQISHGEAGPKHLCAAIDRWNAEQLAYLLGRLVSVRQGGESLLDGTLIMWVNEFGTWSSYQHEYRNLAWVLAGGGWHLRTGRFLRVDDQPHGKLLTSVMHAFDLPTDNVGTRAFGEGPLAGLT